MNTPCARKRFAIQVVLATAVVGIVAGVSTQAEDSPKVVRPTVVEINMNHMIQPVSAEYMLRGIRHANEINAAAVLIVLSTPGGLEKSLREMIKGMIESEAPVIVYVSPSGSRAASAGFFLLLAADVAVMARDSDNAKVVWHRPANRKTLVEMLNNVTGETLGDLHRSGELEAGA